MRSGVEDMAAVMLEQRSRDGTFAPRAAPAAFASSAAAAEPPKRVAAAAAPLTSSAAGTSASAGGAAAAMAVGMPGWPPLAGLNSRSSTIHF